MASPALPLNLANRDDCLHCGGDLPREAHLFLKVRGNAAKDNDACLCAFDLGD